MAKQRPLRQVLISMMDCFTSPGDCLNWTGCKTHNGYGQLTFRQTRVRAHRAAYEEFIGPIPKGALIMHTCDNRSCVNPEHLRPGTPKDNTHDMLIKGRHDWSGLKYVKED
jgi:hypothetical protein